MFTAKDIPDLESLASNLGIKDFDILVVGDGAGSFANTECGWYCLSYDRNRKTVTEYFGGTNSGTNNYAELEPGVQSINAYRHVLYSHYVQATDNKGEALKMPLRIVIVSDSEITVKCGNKEYARKANKPIWASLEWLESKGYQISWKWVPRNSNKFNDYADVVAKRVRKSFKEIL